jgi:hypothetical protein
LRGKATLGAITSARIECTAASGAGIGHAAGHKLGAGDTASHALNRLGGRSDRFFTRFRPAQVGGQTMKELVHFRIPQRLFFFRLSSALIFRSQGKPHQTL